VEQNGDASDYVRLTYSSDKYSENAKQ